MTAASALIVEDEAVTALDLQELLESAGYAVTAIAATATAALSTLAERPPDLALVDIHLADGSDGITLAAEISRRVNCPIIFLTAHGDQAIVARAEEVMPAAFLLKPFNEREVIIAMRLALAKHASDRALRASERRYATTLAGITDGVFVVDLSERIILLNPAAAALTGWTATEAVGRPLRDVVHLTAGVPDADTEQAAGGAPEPWWRLQRPDGSVCEVSYGQAPLVDDHGNTAGAVLVFRDMTAQRQATAERRRLEQQLHAAQRIESLGVIAGGIAHDFNNILAVVSGYTELALIETDPASSTHALLSEAMHGLQRAGELTRQLLLYAGRGPILLQTIDLNALLRDMHALMHAALGPLIELTLNCAEDLPPIQGDPTQLRQVILNLLTNAAEAMAQRGGRVTLTTRAVIREAGADLPTPEAYAEISVTDQGEGMDAVTQQRIFDPFFTTKRTGRGLGLATVQGIVRRHKGTIRVRSTPGVGTTMQILLPTAQQTPETAASSDTVAEQPAEPGALPQPAAAAGLLLIIDDEPEVREVAARLLQRLGYRTVTVADGAAGIAALQPDTARFRGALVDLNMPGEHGVDVAAALRAVQPHLPIVLMSGYLEEIALSQTPPLADPLSFLQKPFTLHTLTEALATVGLYQAQT